MAVNRSFTRNSDNVIVMRALVAMLALLTLGPTGAAGRVQNKSRNGKNGSPSRVADEEATGRYRFDFDKMKPSRASSQGHRMFRLKGARLQSSMENGQMILTGMQGGVANGVLQMKGRINMSTGSGPQSAEIKVQSVDINEVFELLQLQTGGIAARVSGLLNMDWSGLEPEAMRQTLDGTIALDLASGSLRESVLLQKLRELSGISDLDSLNFDSGSIRAEMQNGNMKLQSLQLDGPEIHLDAKGTVGLADNRMDVAVAIDVPQQVARRSRFYQLSNMVGFFSKDKPLKETAAGLVEVPRFSLQGKLDNPEVKWQTQVASVDTAQIEKAAVPSPEPEKKITLALPGFLKRRNKE